MRRGEVSGASLPLRDCSAWSSRPVVVSSQMSVAPLGRMAGCAAGTGRWRVVAPESPLEREHCVKKCIYAYGKHDLNMM